MQYHTNGTNKMCIILDNLRKGLKNLFQNVCHFGAALIVHLKTHTVAFIISSIFYEVTQKASSSSSEKLVDRELIFILLYLCFV